VGNVPVAGLKQRFGATARRRLALVVLLVVGGGMIMFILLHHGEPSRAASSKTSPAGRVVGAGEIAAAGSEVVAGSAPGPQFAPMRISIPAIGASAPVDPLGLNGDGTLQVPLDFGRAGYYTGRPPPGATGPAIIVAHVDSKSGPAVFARLRDLRPGDEVTVTRADGSDVGFVIDRLESHPKNAFPTAAVYDPTPGATLRLITCGGSFDRRAGHYRDNLIAFAHYTTATPPPAQGDHAAQPVMRAKTMTLSR
jgi:sortase (surface protein transpeptidase)